MHIPAQYSPAEPAALMVYQDGMYSDPAEGEIGVGVVADNLIHRREMPMTLRVFVDPGEPENHNIEYDAFDDR